eukprot:1149430-Pelagomonas_calceolata.AAC.3
MPGQLLQPGELFTIHTLIAHMHTDVGCSMKSQNKSVQGVYVEKSQSGHGGGDLTGMGLVSHITADQHYARSTGNSLCSTKQPIGSVDP